MKQQKILAIFGTLILLLSPIANAHKNSRFGAKSSSSYNSSDNSNSSNNSSDSSEDLVERCYKGDLYGLLTTYARRRNYTKFSKHFLNNINDIDVNKPIHDKIESSTLFDYVLDHPAKLTDATLEKCLYTSLLKAFITKGKANLMFYDRYGYDGNALERLIYNIYVESPLSFQEEDNNHRPYIDEPFIEIIELLINKKINLDKHQDIILDIAEKNCVHLADVLFEHHLINVNYQDDAGKTPLMVACEHCCYDMAKWLLSNGANPNLKDDDGETAIKKISKSSSSSKLRTLLKQYGSKDDCVIC